MIPVPREYFMRKADVVESIAAQWREIEGWTRFKITTEVMKWTSGETRRDVERRKWRSRSGENEERTGPTGKQRPSPEKKFMKIYSWFRDRSLYIFQVLLRRRGGYQRFHEPCAAPSFLVACASWSRRTVSRVSWKRPSFGISWRSAQKTRKWKCLARLPGLAVFGENTRRIRVERVISRLRGTDCSKKV